MENRSLRNPNLRKPKEPDYKKKLLLSLIEPFYEKDKRSDSEKCIDWRSARVYVPHPLIVMLKDDCVKELRSKFIYLFHMNSISEFNFNELRKDFLRKNIFLRNYTPEVMELAIKDSKFLNLIQFFKHYSCFAFSETEKLDEVSKLCKESDRITLLGGIFENRILNLQQLEQYKKLGNLDMVRGQLCNTLSTHSTQLSSTLTYHTKELAFNLNNYAKNDSSKKDES